jgi:uncharacterized protein YhfF
VTGGQEPLPRAEFAFPGPLRDRLVAAILDGSKTATTSLLHEYEHFGEPLPRAGSRSELIDSADEPVAVIETVEVRVVPLADVDLAHARDEGEGHETVAAWRAGHERFWHSEEMRAALGDGDGEEDRAGDRDAAGGAAFTVDDATPVVLERFRLVDDLRPR